jgi:hypothetical protein
VVFVMVFLRANSLRHGNLDWKYERSDGVLFIFYGVAGVEGYVECRKFFLSGSSAFLVAFLALFVVLYVVLGAVFAVFA